MDCKRDQHLLAYTQQSLCNEVCDDCNKYYLSLQELTNRLGMLRIEVFETSRFQTAMAISNEATKPTKHNGIGVQWFDLQVASWAHVHIVNDLICVARPPNAPQTDPPLPGPLAEERTPKRAPNSK